MAGPLLAALRIKAVFRALETAHAQGQPREATASRDTREAAVELIASENHIPRFLARRIFGLLAQRLSLVQAPPDRIEPTERH